MGEGNAEMVDVYDESMRRLGVAERKVAQAAGLWLSTFHCWLYREASDGPRVVFQLRASTKDRYAGLFDVSAAGHLMAGEDPLEGVREIREELGLEIEASSLARLGIKHETSKEGDFVNRQFCNVFLGKIEAPVESAGIGLDEVDGVVEMSVDEGLALFSGEAESARVVGARYDRGTRGWVEVDQMASLGDFVPRVDSYYLRVFSLVKRAIAGDRHLAI